MKNLFDKIVRLLMSPPEEGGGGLTEREAIDAATRVIERLKKESESESRTPQAESVRRAFSRAQPQHPSRLAEQIAAQLRIPPRWLNPIRDALDEIEKLARRRDVPDDELLTLLDRAAQRLPEVFERMDKAALQHTFESALGGVVLNTVAEKLDRSSGS